MDTTKANHVSLKTFVNNFKSYRNKEVVLVDYPIFTYDEVVYDEYVLKVGPRGGIKVCYSNNKTLNVTVSSFKNAYESCRQVTKINSGYYGGSTTIFPTVKQMPNVIKSYLTSLREKEAKYKRLYEKAESKVQKFNKILESYPEYTI